MSERLEQALPQELIERLSRHDLDDAAEGVEAGLRAVGPARAGLELERAHAEPRDVVRERVGRLAGDRGLADVAVAHRAAREARGVREQVADGDLALGGHRVEPRRRRRLVSARRRTLPRQRNRDLQILEARDVLRHRIGDAELALLHHHHDRDAGDRLGHRRDAEHRVLRHRLLRLDVGDAGRFEVRDTPVARHQRHAAADLARRDVALHHLRDAPQPLAGETRHPRASPIAVSADGRSASTDTNNATAAADIKRSLAFMRTPSSRQA